MLRVHRFILALSLLLSGVLGSFAASTTFAAPSSSHVPVPANAGIVITKRPGTVRRGATASVAITTAANASCAITVRSTSGPSKAQGLGPKQANANGVVSWAWKVGTRTTAGSWPVSMTCAGHGSVHTTVRVP